MSTELAKELIPKLLAFVEKAGKFALEKQGSASSSTKSDNSIVTETDLAISKMTHDDFAEYFAKENHVLIDEETVLESGTPSEVVGKYEYLWAVDPIDGTSAYASKLPFWGVSLGVLKNDKPWLGVVYLPKLCELYVCDGEKSYYIENPFTKDEIKHDIVANNHIAQKNDNCGIHTIILDSYNWSFDISKLYILRAYVSANCYLASGKFYGTVYQCSIWDFAGMWPILISAGCEMRNIHTGEVNDSLNINDYNNKWFQKDAFISSNEENYKLIKSALTPRDDIKTKSTYCVNKEKVA